MLIKNDLTLVYYTIICYINPSINTEVQMTEDNNTERFLRAWIREYKKGFLTYFILLLLKENPMYGLEIADELKNIPDRSVRLHGSNIYQILKKLKLYGMVSSKMRDSSKGPARKCLPGSMLCRFTSVLPRYFRSIIPK